MVWFKIVSEHHLGERPFCDVENSIENVLAYELVAVIGPAKG